MLIRTNKLQIDDHALIGKRFEDDKVIFTHAQNVTPYAEYAQALAKEQGSGLGRRNQNMRLIGSIPPLIFFQHPEWKDDPSLIRKWLNSDEGSMFRAVDRRV